MTSSSSPPAQSRAAEHAPALDGRPRHAALRRLGIAAGSVAIALLWLPQLGSGYWLDETGTYWVVKDGLGDAIRRSSYQGQSPLYYVIAWCARVLGGSSEVALRMPSLLAMSGATVVLYRLARRVSGQRGAVFAAFAFASLIGIRFAATDARPYALAILTLAGSTLSLLRWLEHARRRDAIAWAVLTSLTVYLTYMFAVAFAAHVIAMVVHRRRGGVISARAFALAIAGAGVLTLPAVPRLLDVLGRSDILTFAAPTPGVRALVEAVLPHSIAVALAAAVVVALTRGQAGFAAASRGTGAITALGLWLIPPLTFFLLAQTIGSKFFQARYILAGSLGLAIIVGIVFGSLRPRAAGSIAIAVTMALSFAYRANGDAHHQDWHAATRAAQQVITGPDTPVLIHTAFATRRSANERDEVSGLVLAPLAAYPLPGRIMPLPYEPPDDIDALAIEAALDSRTIVLIHSFSSRYPDLIGRWLASHGYLPEPRYKSRHLDVIAYRRTASQSVG